jgi:hypothetical protein
MRGAPPGCRARACGADYASLQTAVIFALPASRWNQQDEDMKHAAYAREFSESRIEDEPILGTVLVMPDGRVQPLTFFERVKLMLGLTNAKALEARYRALLRS